MSRFGNALLGIALVAWGAVAVADTSPYAGFQGRQIKALAPERAADLLAGRGAGYALAAELNGYPGPIHVLELAEALHLSPRQRSQVQALFDAMRDEAKVLGRALIERESELDRMFAEAHVTPRALESAVGHIAELEGRLRATHLRYHLETRAILRPDQIAQYAKIRGYAADDAQHTKPGHGHGGNR